MNWFDKHLDRTFDSLGARFTRTGLFKRAAVVAGAVTGFGLAPQGAIASHTPCGAEWGACEGILCCGCYNGCKCRGEAYFCGCRGLASYVKTANWSRCCGTTRYDWYDCGYFNSNGTCYGGGGCPSYMLGCGSCNPPSQCGLAYVSCYRCTFRVTVDNAC
jgi:hypothetical protein